MYAAPAGAVNVFVAIFHVEVLVVAGTSPAQPLEPGSILMFWWLESKNCAMIWVDASEMYASLYKYWRPLRIATGAKLHLASPSAYGAPEYEAKDTRAAAPL